MGQGLHIHVVSRSHTATRHSRYDSSGRVISSQYTQHSQQTDIHAPGGIRTHNLSRRAVADALERAATCTGCFCCRFHPFLQATKTLSVSRGIALLFVGPRYTRWRWEGQPHAPAASTPGKDPVPIVQEVGWATRPVWTGRNSRPHRDSIPDSPARSQSLYRLSYRAHVFLF